MKRYEDVSETKVVHKFVEMTCDLCGATSKGYPEHWDSINEFRRCEELTIERRIFGYESDDWCTEQYDVCPKCWKAVIVPLFAAKGVEPRIVD